MRTQERIVITSLAVTVYEGNPSLGFARADAQHSHRNSLVHNTTKSVNPREVESVSPGPLSTKAFHSSFNRRQLVGRRICVKSFEEGARGRNFSSEKLLPRELLPAELPLVLRREPFGGLLFEPSTATCVELDEEAYSTLRRALAEERQPASDEERALMEQLRASIPSLGRDVVRCHVTPDRASRISRYAHARVLDAPTVVDLQITRRCRSGCPHCYMSSSPDGVDMPYDQVREVLHAAGELGV